MKVLCLIATLEMILECINYATGVNPSQLLQGHLHLIWWIPTIGWISYFVDLLVNYKIVKK